MIEDWHIAYRPDTLGEVYGHEETVKSIQLFFDKNKVPHAFFFSGIRGVGKTTFAKIIGRFLGCFKKPNLIMYDAGRNSKVEDTRELLSKLRYKASGINEDGTLNPIKFIVIDEAHSLSPSAFKSLLKVLEEDMPDHVYFCFCTTEPDKVPDTIRSRCKRYHLPEVSPKIIFQLLFDICEAEELSLKDDSLRLIAEKSNGSVRDAVTDLEKCQGCESVNDVRMLIQSPDENEEIIELLRSLMNDQKRNWKTIVGFLKSFKEQGIAAETIRISIVNWFGSCLLRETSDRKAGFIAYLSGQFTERYFNTGTAFSELSRDLAGCLTVYEKDFK